MWPILKEVYGGNTVLQYLIIFGGIVLAWIVLQVIKRVVFRRVKKWTSHTANRIDDIVISGLDKFIVPYIFLLIIFLLIQQLNLTKKADHILYVAMAVVTAFYLIRLFNHGVQLLVVRSMERRHEGAERIRQINGLLIVVKALVWFGGL